jgi:hypothetical protein
VRSLADIGVALQEVTGWYEPPVKQRRLRAALSFLETLKINKPREGCL